MEKAPQVMVEFYGVPRHKAGRAQLSVRARTIGEMLLAVQESCPGLAGIVQADGRMAPHYLLSIDGRQFTANASDRLTAGARVLILSADAGG